MPSPDKFFRSRLGALNEQLKTAYAAGKRIFVIVTDEPESVAALLDMHTLFPATCKERDGQGNAVDVPTLVVTDSQDFFPATPPTAPHLYLFTGAPFPEGAVGRFVHFLTGPGAQRSFSEAHRFSAVMVLATEPPATLPQGCGALLHVARLDPPGAREVEEILSLWLHEHEGIPLEMPQPDGRRLIADSDFLKRVAMSLRGLSESHIRRLLTETALQRGRIYRRGAPHATDALVKALRSETQRAVTRSAALSIVDCAHAPAAAGVDAMERWISQAAPIITNPGAWADYHLLPPKGVLMCGVPGSGKSMMAKHLARELGLPLVRLDMGNALGRYVGDSEKGIATALRVAQGLAPCVLWIDELEKALEGGHEVTRRIVGKLLTWMQEKDSRGGASCFIFATANDISRMPPEMFRSGRFDEKFFTFMPSANDCARIFMQTLEHQNSEAAKAGAPRLFDTTALTAARFIRLLESDVCLPHRITQNDHTFVRTNKFLTGADISRLIESAKSLYVARVRTASPAAPERGAGRKHMFSTALFTECLEEAMKAMRSYGETNMNAIAECYSRLAINNFRNASGDDNEVVPFSGYDEVRYLSEKDEKRRTLYALRDEDSHLSRLPSDYDRQLYLAVRNALNLLAPALTRRH